MAEPVRLVLTCEHGGCDIPSRWAGRFAGRERWLNSHRGWDAGAATCARVLQRVFRCPLVLATTSRLLIDLNRPSGDPGLFSTATRGLPANERAELLARIHARHWNRVRRRIGEVLRDGPVLHVGVHTFTPVYRGCRRDTDIGLLFDPARHAEAAFARNWAEAIAAAQPRWTVAFNRPYHGADPGLTTSLRDEFPKGYLGLELEINRRLAVPPARARVTAGRLAAALAAARHPGHGLGRPVG